MRSSEDVDANVTSATGAVVPSVELKGKHLYIFEMLPMAGRTVREIESTNASFRCTVVHLLFGQQLKDPC